MKHERRLLIFRLDRYEPHRWALHRLTNCFRIPSVTLLAFHIRFDELRRRQSHLMAKPGDFTRPIVRRMTRFNADKRRLK